MTKQLVSICIPTYNRPEYLLEAVKSCLNQTYQNFEIIISDNSDNFNSKNAIEALNSPKIKYIKNEGNQGSYFNFVNLLTFVSGEFVKYLMDDDLLKPDCLEKMVKAMNDNPSVGVVMAPLDIVNEKAENIRQRFYFIHNKKYLYKYKTSSQLIKGKHILLDYLIKEYPCCVPTGVMYKTECFKKMGVFDRDANFAGDVEICMRFATKYDFYYIDQILSSWRFNSNSDTANIHMKGLDVSAFYYLVKKYIDSEFVKKELSYVWFLRRRAFLFATKRCVLNIFAGIASRSIKMILWTVLQMFKHENYKTNVFLFPFSLSYEIKKAIKDNFSN